MLEAAFNRKRRRSGASLDVVLLCWALLVLLPPLRLSSMIVSASFVHVPGVAWQSTTRIKLRSPDMVLDSDHRGAWSRPPRKWLTFNTLLRVGPLASSLASPSPSSGAAASSPSPSDKSKRYNNTNSNKKRKPSKRDQIRNLFRKAKTLERQGQWRQAKCILQEILVLDPRDAHSHLALSRLEARRCPESHETASRRFQEGTTACPDSVHLWQAWALHEESHGDYVRARQLLERALQLDAYNPYVCHAYGLMELRLQNRERAKQLWEQALERTSTAALVCSLGEWHIAARDYTAARQLYQEHVEHLETEREITEVFLAAAWLEERYLRNFDRAVELLETALQLSPHNSLASVALARLESRRSSSSSSSNGDDAAVRRLAESCARLEKQQDGGDDDDSIGAPGDGRVYNAWASLRVKANRFQEARQILRRGLARYPKDHTLLQAAGKVEERVGNFTGARQLYSASVSIEPSAPALVAYALLNIRHPEVAEVKRKNSSLNNTLGLFEEALLLDKRHGPAYNAYARTVFEKLSNENRARSIYERGLHANCTDAASIYHGYARMELSLGNVHRARELLLQGNEEVRRISAGTDSPHRDRAVFLIHTLGMLELNSNRPAAALDVFTDGIERYGNSSQLLLGAGLCEGRLGNEDKARHFFERSVLSDEKHAQAWQAWGVMEMRAGNLKTAKTLLECGIRSAPNYGALWQAYGVMESRLHHVETARALFHKGIEVQPKLVSLYQSWASLELREGDFNAAKALISQALTLDKTNGSGWLIAAEIEERLGNRGLGNLILRRGIECAPNNAQLYRALGDDLLRMGKIDEARVIMEQGIEVDPMYAPLYHSLAELEARVFNLEALARLNKKAAAFFNANALEPAPSSLEAWGSKIRRAAGRGHGLSPGVEALAERIVEEQQPSHGREDLSILSENVNPSAFLERMMSSTSRIEEDLVEGLLHPLQQDQGSTTGDDEKLYK